MILGAIACSTQRSGLKVIENEELTVNDSIEYELETFDGKFETWYQLHKLPSMYRSLEYYESWNQRYVIAWNTKAMHSGSSFFEPIVGYDPTEDYGFDLNHELFYYFQYVEKVLGIPIMAVSPNSVLF